MANWNTLKTAIADVINANGNQAITGQLLQNVLNNIITNVGENATFAGIATLDTNPGVPDGPVFYLTATAGTYPNFNGIEVQDGEAIILLWNNNAWSKKVAITDFATQKKLSALGIKKYRYAGKTQKGALHNDGKIYDIHTAFRVTDFIRLNKGDFIISSGISYVGSSYKLPTVCVYTEANESTLISNIILDSVYSKLFEAKSPVYVRVSYQIDYSDGVFIAKNGINDNEDLVDCEYLHKVDIAVPNKTYNSGYVTTFLCKKGDLVKGNFKIDGYENTITEFPLDSENYDSPCFAKYGYVVTQDCILQVITIDRNAINVYRNWDFEKVSYFTTNKEYGVLKNGGNISKDNVNYYTSDFIQVSKGDIIEYQSDGLASPYSNISLYDSNKTFVRTLDQYNFKKSHAYIKQNGYVKISTPHNNECIAYKVRFSTGNPNIDIITFNISSKTFGFLGDSITAYGQYTDAFRWLVGKEIVNYGISGTAISGTDENNAMCKRYIDMSDDLDVVIVMGGVNDQRGGIPLGDISDFNLDGSKDNTFYGALHTLMRGLKNKYKNKPIFFMTPLHNSYRDDDYGDTGDYNYYEFSVNGKLVENKFPLRDKKYIDDTIATGDVLSKYVDAIKKLAAFYAIPVIDTYSNSWIQPILEDNKNLYTSDGIHLNDEGGRRIALILKEYFNSAPLV